MAEAEVIPEDVKYRLYLAALKRDGMGIKPVRGGKSFLPGFIVHGNRACLYYNVPDDPKAPGTTRIVWEELTAGSPPVERPAILLLRL